MKVYTLKLKYSTITGPIVTAKYPNGTTAVMIEDAEGGEVLSINLQAYGLIPTDPRVFYVGDYSEHVDKADALVHAGIATVTQQLNLGPHQARFFEMRLADHIELPYLRNGQKGGA